MNFDENKNYQNQLRGARNRASGEIFERYINAACIYYEQLEKAIIEKTPEPMRVIKNMGYGKFLAHFEKKAQPDYKGTLREGKTIVFEAKHTDGDRIEQNRLTDIQFQGLEKYSALGAECFVLVSIQMEIFALVPWTIWQNMKSIYKRKYMTSEELKEYQVPFRNGVIQFLNNY